MDRALNAFESYHEFLDTGTSSIKSKNKGNKNYVDDDEFDVCDVYDIHNIVKQKFFKADYPTDLLNANIFCPLCGKFVTQSDLHETYYSQSYKRNFLAHGKCIHNASNRMLNDVFDEVEDMIYTPIEDDKQPKLLLTGDRQFCLELTIAHPLSDFKFVKLVTKCNPYDKTLRWQLRKQQEEDESGYEPNIICFPFLDFKVSLIISQIESQQKKKVITVYVNLSRTKLNTLRIMAKSNQITIKFLIHNTKKQKQQVISAMNYKYRYPQQIKVPIIQIQSIQIQMPQQKFQEQIEQQYSNNSSIMNLLSQDYNSSVASSSFHINSLNGSQHHKSFNGDNNGYKWDLDHGERKGTDRSIVAEKEKIQFQNIVSTGKLSSYVRNGAQSRNFQKFLSEASQSQIDIIIKTLIDELSDLVVNDYANYMTQKLFEVSNSTQRQIMLEKLYPDIPNLVRNKQGTHTIQSFLSHLVLKQEVRLITKSIRKQFEDLCFHPISTHFIQKVIKVFEIQDTLEFYEYANKNFLKFATDKNAMCVLKYMLKRVHEFKDIPIIFEIRKHFINSITLNTHKIIQDSYGNYVIQFCYELFGETRSSGITEMILEKFVQFSLQRYSSSVISKCISLYWTDKSYALRLKESLSGESIIEMYRNKQGNKILLDLMDNNEISPLRQKIYNHLANTGESSRFYRERWDMQKGIKSGPVGFEFKSFTQADSQHQKSYNGSRKSKKKKMNS